MPQNQKTIQSHITSQNSPIEHNGNLEIQGNVEASTSVTATGNITISGHVFNAKVTSLNGNIEIKDGIKGSQSLLTAPHGSIKCLFVQNATLKSDKDIIVNGMILDGHIITKSSILAQTREGNIEGGEIEAGIDIVAYNLGSKNNSPTSVKISDFHQRDLYNRLLNIEQEIKILKNDRTQLEKYIQIIKILGNKVINLPLEKKQDLAEKVQKFQSLGQKISQLEEIKNHLFIPEEEKDELERSVIIRGQVFPGAKITIDKAKLDIQQIFKNVILYKRGIIIVGDYDQFMHRKKYS